MRTARIDEKIVTIRAHVSLIVAMTLLAEGGDESNPLPTLLKPAADWVTKHYPVTGPLALVIVAERPGVAGLLRLRRTPLPKARGDDQDHHAERAVATALENFRASNSCGGNGT